MNYHMTFGHAMVAWPQVMYVGKNTRVACVADQHFQDTGISMNTHGSSFSDGNRFHGDRLWGKFNDRKIYFLLYFLMIREVEGNCFPGDELRKKLPVRVA